MIRFSYILFLISGLLIISLTYCNRDKVLPEPSHAFLTKSEFNNLSRAEQVKNCGSCHPKQYENEMKGPHANAYKMLEAHVDYINSPGFDHKEYCKYVSVAKNNCIGCHASKTLYKEVYNSFPDNMKSVMKLTTEQFPYPQVRSDKSSYITGIDCITCHYDGNRVVTSLNAPLQYTMPNAACPTYCSPRKSAIFSSNANCVACHKEQVQDMDNNFETSVVKSKDCNSCHGEYDSKGEFTHYYYWAHDPADKARPKQLDIFAGIQCNVNQQRSTVDIVWNNTTLPHPVSECTELTAKLSAYNEAGKLIATKTIHANRKPKQDENLKKHYGDKPVPGTHDFTIGNNVKSKSFSMPLPQSQSGKIKVVLQGIKLEQYWLSDTLGTQIHYREIIL